MDLAALLPSILPGAIAWAEQQSALVLSTGAPLPQHCVADARAVGVQAPELIRVAIVTSLPLPYDPTLRGVALSTGLLGPNMVGLTLGHAVIVVNGHATRRLLTHEFRHVHQYETAGSIATFLPTYLQQIATFGYEQAPLEVDARQHEMN
ncbi:hypothetical protein LMG28688_06602 [Paraburkholderia caffeinitolerans]|uniref:DUF4157 domain-containing protein n=1 Tax=Paraburkholderia caffeinitolerans TaxID=1723730 RepID=A0A6J5H295_9BURK|nr:hypothetical protein [Paraburkholderia caffeinitolerans]CAB3807741.1 hypothetical protein LMG28688_06602 [Paraburkholderia caffeinitolerans]